MLRLMLTIMQTGVLCVNAGFEKQSKTLYFCFLRFCGGFCRNILVMKSGIPPRSFDLRYANQGNQVLQTAAVVHHHSVQCAALKQWFLTFSLLTLPEVITLCFKPPWL